MNDWSNCKNLLCIRPDNMGDLIMTGPALRALKETFGCKITVLTSSAAAGIAAFMPEVDEVITFDVPWVKNKVVQGPEDFNLTIKDIKPRNFDAAIIFTVYSQNPLPTVMLAYLADIPLRLAYCRENPYQLLTDWVHDKEPYTTIKHQVQRDLDLVATIGATSSNDKLSLKISNDSWPEVQLKLTAAGVNPAKRWILLHPGVSEEKRSFPPEMLIETAKLLIKEYDLQVLFTGAANEKILTNQLQTGTGNRSFSIAGLFNIDEFLSLVNHAELLISVNSGPVHIAAALQTPVIVLYAQTNPQHTPWKSPNRVLYYSIDEAVQSKNEVIRFVNDKLYRHKVELPSLQEIVKAVKELIDLQT